jgi:hypothetical protein
VSSADVAPRVLLRNEDGTVTLEGEALVAVCDGRALDHVVRRVSTFAFAVGALVATLAVTGIAPRAIGLFVVTWTAAAGAARCWARKRRREHGRIVVDLDARAVRAATHAGPRELPLDDQATFEIEGLDDPGDHARWLLLRRGEVRFRLGHAPPAELRPILVAIRRHGIAAPHV